MNTGLEWLDKAYSYIGEREIKGAKHNPLILRMWDAIKSSWFKDDETPWCAGFVGLCLEESGIKSTRSASALSYEKFGVKLDRPAVGCIVTFKRSGGGHVGFVVGKDRYGNLMVLGGNQGDMVSIKPFSTGRVTSYRWPSVYPAEHRFDLPIINSDGRVSTNEA
jgi:uncharacterized protein (TIGR02594 family)